MALTGCAVSLPTSLVRWHLKANLPAWASGLLEKYSIATRPSTELIAYPCNPPAHNSPPVLRQTNSSCSTRKLGCQQVVGHVCSFTSCSCRSKEDLFALALSILLSILRGALEV